MTLTFFISFFYGYLVYKFLEYKKKWKFKLVLFFKRQNKRKKNPNFPISTKIQRFKLKVPFIQLFSNNMNRICLYLSQSSNKAWTGVLTIVGFALSFLTLILNSSIWLNLWNKLWAHTAVAEREINSLTVVSKSGCLIFVIFLSMKRQKSSFRNVIFLWQISILSYTFLMYIHLTSITTKQQRKHSDSCNLCFIYFFFF